MNFNNDFDIYGNPRQVIGGGEAQQTSYPQTLLDEYGFPLQPYDFVTADAHHQQTYQQYGQFQQSGYQPSLPHMQQQNPFTYHSQQQNPYNYSQHQTQQHSGPHTFVPPRIFNYWPQTAPPPQQSSFPTYSTPSVFSAPSDSSLSTIQPQSSGAVPASSNLPNHGDMDFQIRMAQTQIAGLEKDVEEAQKEYDALADQLSLDRLFQEMSAEPCVKKHAQLEYEYEQAKKELKNSGSTRTRRQTRLNEARKRLSKLTNSRGREVTTGKVTRRKDNPQSESLPPTATSTHSSDTSTHHTVPSTALNTSSFTSLITDERFQPQSRSLGPTDRQRDGKREPAASEEARKKLVHEVAKAKGAVGRSQARVDNYLPEMQRQGQEIAELERNGGGRTAREKRRNFAKSLEGKVRTLNQCKATLEAAETALYVFDREHGIISSVRRT